MLCLLSLLALFVFIPPATPPVDSLYSESIERLQLRSDELGEGWTGPEGILIEDFDTAPDTSDAGSALQFRMMKKLFPQVGIDGYAEWEYHRVSEDDIIVLSVKVLRFGSVSEAEAWWTQKHAPEQEGRDYTRVEGAGDAAVDVSMFRAMRYVRVGNVVLQAIEARAVLRPWEPSGIHREVLRVLAERVEDHLG